MELFFVGLPILIIAFAVIGPSGSKGTTGKKTTTNGYEPIRYNSNGVPMHGNSGLDILGNPAGSTLP